jgi:outer membrane protein assembly factor BamB
MNHTFIHWCREGILQLVLLCTALNTSILAADWPRFRGSTGDGISNDAKIPTEWSDNNNLTWKLEMPGKGFSSPIVVGDYVFVTCYSGVDGDLKNLKRHLLCVHRHEGEVVWSSVVLSAAPEIRGPSYGTSHGYASHTPVSDGERVYVVFGNTGVLAFDMKGKQLWQRSIGTENAARFGSAASPILYKERLIVIAGAESESIYALETETGQEIWKTEASNLSRCYCTPMAVKTEAGEDELLISVPYEVWSLDPDTGERKWYAETKVDRNAVASPITQDRIVYVVGGRRGGGAAIRLGGKGDVTQTNVLWSTPLGSYVSSPVLYKGHLYWFTHRGIAFCVDAKTGKEIARKRLGGQFYASAVLVKDKLYAVSRFDGTYVLEATPELTQVAHNRLSGDSDFSGSPAVSNGQLILRSNDFLYCIERD